MHLIFERYKGRFRSNCNILALAWMPYYQESKFRQSLLEYHQRQLAGLSRSAAGATNELQAASGEQPTSVNLNNDANINLVRPPGGPNGNGLAAAAAVAANGDQFGGGAAPSKQESKQMFLNARLAEQHQRYAISSRNKNPSASKNAIKTTPTSEANQQQQQQQQQQNKASESRSRDYASINEELDAHYGRMAEFGWLAIGNIGKMVGVTLTSTVEPPEEIDGRRKGSSEGQANDLIQLDDTAATAGAEAELNQDIKPAAAPEEEAAPGLYEQVRPDRKCARNNYNLRGHLDEIILVKWNELYQKLATVDSKGNVLIWCKVNEKFTIQTPFYNRSKSVADFKWSNDGKTALICYTDSFILVGSSSSQRHWHSMLNLDDYHITCASWAPNDQQLLLGVSNGNVVVIDLPHSELTELVVGLANIRTMCWSSCDMNLRNLKEESSGQDASGCGAAWPNLGLGDGGAAPLVRGRSQSRNSSAIVNQRRLSRDCSVFSRYRSNSPDEQPANVSSRCLNKAGGEFLDRQRNVLAIDFANNTIKLYDGGLEDPKPRNIAVHLESYLMAWSADGRVLAVAGFNISTTAPSIGCLRCRYLNHVKFYNQQGALLADSQLSSTRYPITALAWAHDDQRLFLATGPRLHCARVFFGVPKLAVLALSCVHRNTKYPTKMDILNSLFKQQQQQKQQQPRSRHSFKNASLLNWQSANCPLELERMLAPSSAHLAVDISAPILTSGGGCTTSSSSSSGEGERAGGELAVLRHNANIAHFRLPAKLKMAVDQLFLQTLRQPFDEQLALADVAWLVPKSQQRCYCTLICYTHELVDLGCGASMGHQYRTPLELAAASRPTGSSGDSGKRQQQSSNKQQQQLDYLSGQTSDQFKIFVLYVECQGSLVPILKARRIGFLKPEFVIFDPEDTSGRRHPRRRQKVSDIGSLHGQQRGSAAAGADRRHQSNEPFFSQQAAQSPLGTAAAADNCTALHTAQGNQNGSASMSPLRAPSGKPPVSQLNFELISDSQNRQNQLRLNILPDGGASARATNRAPGETVRALMTDPKMVYLANLHRNVAGRASGSSQQQQQRQQQQQEANRWLAIERYKALAARNSQAAPARANSTGGPRTLPETSELVRVRSNIWGTRFKIINVGNRMIARRAHLGAVTYKASILHLQPRQIFLNLKDMTNYCVLCSMHHHTRATAALEGRSGRARTANGGHCSSGPISLIDLPLTQAAGPLQAVEAAAFAPSSSAAPTPTKRRPAKLTREQRDEQKVLLAVGDSIRVAPKLEAHQRYRLAGQPTSGRSSSRWRGQRHDDEPNLAAGASSAAPRAPASNYRAMESDLVSLTPASCAPFEGKLGRPADSMEHQDENEDQDDILTLSMDQTDQVELSMVLARPAPESERRDEASRRLEEFLGENKTLKSIQTITKMIVDLSSKAQGEERAAQSSDSPSFLDMTDGASPVKLLKLADQSAAASSSCSPPATRYIPPETPVHRPRRPAGRAAGELRCQVARSQSAACTPTRSFRAPHASGHSNSSFRRASGQVEGDDAECDREPSASTSTWLHDDTPLPPPPPSVPFRRRLSSSTKRFFDGSLRSLTGSGGRSMGDELDGQAAEDCEPLVRRRHGRRPKAAAAGGSSKRSANFYNQSQPCTPMRTKHSGAGLDGAAGGRQPPIDLAHLKDQLMQKLWSSSSTSKPAKGGRGVSLDRRQEVEASSSLSCTKKSRWVHRSARPPSSSAGWRGLWADQAGSSSSSSSFSSSSSASSSGSSSSSSSSLDDLSGHLRAHSRLAEAAPSFVERHVSRMRSFGKKSARSLTDLAKISMNHDKQQAGARAPDGAEASHLERRGQQQQQQQELRRRCKRRRRHNRKSLCTNANCCCAREFKLNNRPPVWNETSQVYQLDFGGRVTQESAKNLQIDYEGNLALQFGRIDRCTYTLDYKYPFNAVQAMAIALASLTQRLK